MSFSASFLPIQLLDPKPKGNEAKTDETPWGFLVEGFRIHRPGLNISGFSKFVQFLPIA